MAKVIRLNKRAEKTLEEIMSIHNKSNEEIKERMGIEVKTPENMVIAVALENHLKFIKEIYGIDNVIKKD